MENQFAETEKSTALQVEPGYHQTALLRPWRARSGPNACEYSVHNVCPLSTVFYCVTPPPPGHLLQLCVPLSGQWRMS
jgi:hypothetical protein